MTSIKKLFAAITIAIVAVILSCCGTEASNTASDNATTSSSSTIQEFSPETSENTQPKDKKAEFLRTNAALFQNADLSMDLIEISQDDEFLGLTVSSLKATYSTLSNEANLDYLDVKFTGELRLSGNFQVYEDLVAGLLVKFNISEYSLHLVPLDEKSASEVTDASAPFYFVLENPDMFTDQYGEAPMLYNDCEIVVSDYSYSTRQVLSFPSATLSEIISVGESESLPTIK